MFDPYHKWLAIPLDQRPPTNYQLLGISSGEIDPEVIEEAALQRIAHLRSYQIGAHAKDCTRLLNEIAQAKVVLLNPAKRKEYDAQLRRRPSAAGPHESAQAPAPTSKRLVVAAAAVGVCAVIVVIIAVLASGNRPADNVGPPTTKDPIGAAPKKKEPVKPAAQDVIWFDDALPEGAKLGAGSRTWEWGDSATQPVLSGTHSVKGSGPGHHVRFFHGAAQVLSIHAGDTLFAYVWLDPKDPPQAIMLQFYDGNHWDHRAYWGEDLCEAKGDRDAPHHRFRGPLSQLGKWTRLEVSAEAVGFVPDAKITGIALNQFGGTVYYDKIGISTTAVDDVVVDEIVMPKKKKGKKKK